MPLAWPGIVIVTSFIIFQRLNSTNLTFLLILTVMIRSSRLIHTPQEPRNLFSLPGLREQEQSSFWPPGHFKLTCRTPGKSSKGPPTAAYVTQNAKHVAHSAPGGKRINHAHFELTNHTIVLGHGTRTKFGPDDVARTSCENSRRAARIKPWEREQNSRFLRSMYQPLRVGVRV